MMLDSQLVEEIRRQMAAGGTIPAASVLEWMKTTDIRVMEAVESLLQSKAYDRIQPSLPGEVVCMFLIEFYLRCIRENPDSDDLPGGYIAGGELKELFVSFWPFEQEPWARRCVDHVKHSLAELYRSGDAQVRDCVVNGVLEHLYEDRDIATYFSDWQDDPVLKEAHTQALEWGRAHWR